MRYTTKEAASQAAHEARDRLPTPGHWQIRVFENCGWYWNLHWGPIIVHEAYGDAIPGRYFALISENWEPGQVPAGGSVRWKSLSSDTPWGAVLRAIEVASQVLQQAELLLDQFVLLRQLAAEVHMPSDQLYRIRFIEHRVTEYYLWAMSSHEAQRRIEEAVDDRARRSLACLVEGSPDSYNEIDEVECDPKV